MKWGSPLTAPAVIVAFLGLSMPAAATTFTVSKTADTNDGTCDADCSLREAITAANASVGVADTIQFNIAGGGVKTIQPGSALPAVTDTLAINGTTQPGYTTTPLIELNGVSAGAGVSGLYLQANGCTVEGLAINRFSASGLRIAASNSVIQANFIGTDAAGAVDQGNGGDGILVESGTNNLIGGTIVGDGNIISGNTGAGIVLRSNLNQVLGNKIGTDVTGLANLGNGDSGVVIDNDGTGNLIGGPSAAERNVISANSDDGIEIVFGTGTLIRGNYIGVNVNGTGILGNGDKGISLADSDNTVGGTAAGSGNVISSNGTHGIFVNNVNNTIIQGNIIGTDATGTVNLGNGNAGIHLQGQGSQVGGTASGAGNTIAFNGLDAVVIANSATSTGNAILRNSHYSNGGMGIDLADDNIVTANDALDADTGPNNLQNFPILTIARHSGGTTLFEGVLNSAANVNGVRIEFFSSDVCHGSGNGEGKTYLGSTTVNTGATGSVSFSTSLSVTLAADKRVTATATDPQNNTSEFSACIVSLSSSDPDFLGGGGGGGSGGGGSGGGGSGSSGGTSGGGSGGTVVTHGNGTVESGEECDDGNLVNGDGCSVSGLNESGVSNACANRVLQVGEQCDDGNKTNGDGCNADCGKEVTPNGNEVVLANPGVDFSDLVERDLLTLVAPSLTGTCSCTWSASPAAMATFDSPNSCETDVTLNQRGDVTFSVLVYCGRDGSGTFQKAVTVEPLGTRSSGSPSSRRRGGCSLGNLH